MMRVDVDMPDLSGLGDQALGVVRRGARDAIEDVVMHLVNSIKVKIGGRGSGRFYKRTKGGKMHQASAPGQPPARDFGNYVNSWMSNVIDRPSEIEGQLGSSMWDERGQHLEHGTSRMAPRPHVAPTLEEQRAVVERRLADAVDRGMAS